jgi:glycosyltransferase involved in cell wall biosynthesis
MYYEHGGDLIGTDPVRDMHFYRLFGKQYDAVLVNSEFTRGKVLTLKSVQEHRVRTCYIGVNVEAYSNGSRRRALRQHLGIPERSIVIGTVSRLVEQKGVDDFVRVAAAIRIVRDDCHFIVVGDGDKRKTLEQLAASYNLRIHFLGNRTDVPMLLSMFDIFLYTPRWEPFGIVVVEALAAKIPVLGYRVGGMEEIFMKGGGGLLVDGRDYQQLARVALELLDDERAYRKLSHEGYANVKKNFNIRNTICVLENEYSVLAKAYEDLAH